MKVTQVALRPTTASNEAGRPALTPELLAASGARYSRNNEGLEAILAKIDPDNLDKSVDSIFQMLDYGHQSIADMAPVAIFIDEVSLWLAYFVWSLCPTGSGQESSTRYINYNTSQNVEAETFGIASQHSAEWKNGVARAFEHYNQALETWSELARSRPELTRIPQSLRDDATKVKAVARMERNFAFDRARVFLPACAPTNLMLVMSARAWAQLCAHLSSFPLPETQQLAELIRPELALAAPRLLKHAHLKESLQNGWKQEIVRYQKLAQMPCKYLQMDANTHEHPPTPHLQVLAPDTEHENPFSASEDLQFHDNRYGWIGSGLARTSVRFSWQAVALAEIRDLNRHRTGTKWCPPVPQGFYASLDQWPQNLELNAQLKEAAQLGAQRSSQARERLSEGDISSVYWNLLGTQWPFEHSTTADKFLYEAELRTGTGAHYRYARHLRDALQLWYLQFPETRGLVLEGSAEPE